MESSVLDLTEKQEEDTRIKNVEAFTFLPISGTRYNTPAIIRIDIENQDEFFCPHDSWLEIEGRLVKADGGAYGNNDLVTLTNNGIMYCFQNMKYIMGGNEIESLNNCGQATTMLGMARYSNSFNNGPGLAQGWCPDTTTTASKGTKMEVKTRFLRHSHFKRVLQELETVRVNQNTLRSRNHDIGTYSQTRISLTAFDTKRYVLEDGITTLAHGHYRTREPALSSTIKC